MHNLEMYLTPRHVVLTYVIGSVIVKDRLCDLTINDHINSEFPYITFGTKVGYDYENPCDPILISMSGDIMTSGRVVDLMQHMQTKYLDLNVS